jgi:methionyl-tRNA formyltransferase
LKNYIVVTLKKWNVDTYKKNISIKKKNWFLVTRPKFLNFSYINSIKPKYIFFPHWSEKIDSKIVENFNCICFHETDLPYGRGGSPIQNLIHRDHKKTFITAFKMNNKIDAGPILLKKPLLLNGNAQQIFERSSDIIFKMIKQIINKNLKPKPQKGKVVNFKRRNPKQSVIPKDNISLEKIYNHIRMLDADTYPKAYINHGKFKIEFRDAKLKNKCIDLKALIRFKDLK